MRLLSAVTVTWPDITFLASPERVTQMDHHGLDLGRRSGRGAAIAPKAHNVNTGVQQFWSPFGHSSGWLLRVGPYVWCLGCGRLPMEAHELPASLPSLPRGRPQKGW